MGQGISANSLVYPLKKLIPRELVASLLSIYSSGSAQPGSFPSLPLLSCPGSQDMHVYMQDRSAGISYLATSYLLA